MLARGSRSTLSLREPRAWCSKGKSVAVQFGKHTAATHHSARKDGDMSVCHNLLIAVDDSEATARTVTYVASIIGSRRDVRLYLWHVAPIPPEFLEFGGSENPQVEENREAGLARSRLGCLEDLAQAVFARAQAILDHAGVPAGAVETHFLTTIDGEDLIRTFWKRPEPTPVTRSSWADSPTPGSVNSSSPISRTNSFARARALRSGSSSRSTH
jgi:hypothetical protein